jgi:hypothetical protein
MLSACGHRKNKLRFGSTSRYGRCVKPPWGGPRRGGGPTLSQLHGRVVAAARADHLDVIGHFDHATREPPHFDWLTTGTGFDRRAFETVWERVLGFLLEGLR